MSPNLKEALIELESRRVFKIFRPKWWILTAQQKCPLYSFREYYYNSLKEKLWLKKTQYYFERQVREL